MFGSILSMSKNDVRLSIVISILVIILYLVFYNKIFAITFDESFAQATGINTKKYNSLIAFLTAVTIVLGMRMMGALLISSLIVFPALTSMRLIKSFRGVVISSTVISVSCFVLGIIFSYICAAPTGASVVAVNLALFIIFSVISKIKFKLQG
jgi:zinc transport system permease protein